MSELNTLSRFWFAWIFAQSWQVGLLIGIVALACLILNSSSARFRHALWLLVLLKVFIPPVFILPCGIGTWAIGPMIESTDAAKYLIDNSPTSNAVDSVNSRDDGSVITATDNPTGFADRNGAQFQIRLLVVWGVGFVAFWILVVTRYIRVVSVLRSSEPIEEGPLRIFAERIALSLRLRRIPELLVDDRFRTPFLFGTVRPRIVLPRRFHDELAVDQLQAVLAHELVHWSRYDTWIGWLQVVVQSLFWFHPFVWWANAQLRHERECACDETVLKMGDITPEIYGDSIVQALVVSQGRTLSFASQVAVFEPGANLQQRFEKIMNYNPSRFRSEWISRIALVVFAFVFLPMAPGLQSGQRLQGEEKSAASTKPEAPKTKPPIIVSTVPEVGQTAVAPSLTEIRVTFDRDMAEGIGWVGSAELFPPIDHNHQAKWVDKRTCILPVKLEARSYYRVGINSTSYQNFRSAENVPAPPSVLYFNTIGGSDDRVQIPHVTSLEPANHAADVDPAIQELRVTFDVPMDEGMSWCGHGGNFPVCPEDQPVRWSKDGRTCTLPVQLQPDHDYEIGLNSFSHNNFQSQWGVPLSPVKYSFRTRAAEPK